MTIRELQELLSTFHPDDLVILAKDNENNGFSPLSEVASGHYRAENTYSGEVDEWAADDTVPCTVFYPVN